MTCELHFVRDRHQRGKTQDVFKLWYNIIMILFYPQFKLYFPLELITIPYHILDTIYLRWTAHTMRNKSRLADILFSPLLNQFTPFSSKISDYFYRRCSYGGELEICVDSGIFKTGLKITIVHR